MSSRAVEENGAVVLGKPFEVEEPIQNMYSVLPHK
jgi:hypothetical protein